MEAIASQMAPLASFGGPNPSKCYTTLLSIQSSGKPRPDATLGMVMSCAYCPAQSQKILYSMLSGFCTGSLITFVTSSIKLLIVFSLLIPNSFS